MLALIVEHVLTLALWVQSFQVSNLLRVNQLFKITKVAFA